MLARRLANPTRATLAALGSSNHANFSTSPSPTNTIHHYFSLLHSSPNLSTLRQIHARLIQTTLYHNVILASKLISMYARHSNTDLSDAHNMFVEMPNRNLYTWNIMIGEFSRSSSPGKSLELFTQMRGFGFDADVFTFPLIFRACAGSGAVDFGGSAHGLCVKSGLKKNLFVGSAMVFMYVNLGRVWDAKRVFDEMPERDAVLWTAMLAGYAQHGEPVLALRVFGEMVGEGVELDGVVMVSLLLVCSQLGWLRYGKSVHGWSVRSGLGLGLSLGNALVDMYVKCGDLGCAHRVFDGMPERDVITWSALVLGYGLNGNVSIALDLFDQMKGYGVKPNNVTFLGVLTACAHAGMVDKARFYFEMMKSNGVVGELKHYACMVDCLGRAGLLVEAERFIETMPMEPDGAVLGAVLGGCRLHGNAEVGERIARKLLKLEPERSGYYALLANIYADCGRFSEAEAVWTALKQRNVSKITGYSLI